MKHFCLRVGDKIVFCPVPGEKIVSSPVLMLALLTMLGGLTWFQFQPNYWFFLGTHVNLILSRSIIIIPTILIKYLIDFQKYL